MSKYHSRKIELDGHVFDSQLEGNRYLQLKLLERAGEIKDLELQPKYPLVVNGVKVATYIADFRYTDCKTNQQVVEDSKGFKTRDYRIKNKLMKALFGIEILEIA